VRQEVAVDNFQLRFKTEMIPSARRFISYMINCYVTMAVRIDDVCYLPFKKHKEFAGFQKLLKAQNVLTILNKDPSEFVNSNS